MAASPTVWKNVQVSLQSDIASPVTITGITKDSPAVAAATAHGYSNGDYVYLDVLGMRQVDKKIVRVAGVTTNTFELEGVDSSAFDTFSSGTASKVTMGTTISTATNVSANGGDFKFIDTTTIHDNAESQVPGLPSAISFSMDHIWDPANAGLAALKLASDTQARRAVLFEFGSGGKKLIFTGYVGCTLLPGGQAQGLVTTKAVITLNGTPTYYTS